MLNFAFHVGTVVLAEEVKKALLRVAIWQAGNWACKEIVNHIENSKKE